jgi:ABC-type oligopeptide transport system substrate-binding subunit
MRAIRCDIYVIGLFNSPKWVKGKRLVDKPSLATLYPSFNAAEKAVLDHEARTGLEYAIDRYVFCMEGNP